MVRLSMNRKSMYRIIGGALLAGCGADESVCVPPPCPLPFAVLVNVSGAGGGSLSGVFVNVLSGEGSANCAQSGAPARCFVTGGGGTYRLQIGATGYQPGEWTVAVTEKPAPRCGCRIPNTQQLDVTLIPAS